MIAYRAVHPSKTLALVVRLHEGASCPPCPLAASASAPDILARAPPRVLVKGELEMPVWGLFPFADGALDGGSVLDEKGMGNAEYKDKTSGLGTLYGGGAKGDQEWSAELPFLQFGPRAAGAAGAERRRVRRNLMRRGQM